MVGAMSWSWAAAAAGVVFVTVGLSACGSSAGSQSGKTTRTLSPGSTVATRSSRAETVTTATRASRSGNLFVPSQIVEAGTSVTVFLLGTGRCNGQFCVELWRGQGEHYVQVTAPPNAVTVGSTDIASAQLVFANADDGYALAYGSAAGAGSTAFATIDGGKSWQSVPLTGGAPRGMVATSVAASDGEFYALLGCTGSGGSKCSGLRLARSTAGSTRWSSVPVPGDVPAGAWTGLGAAAGTVFINFPRSRLSAVPRLLTSVNGSPRFTTVAASGLSSGQGACGLSPMSQGAIWALCPQGMTEIYYRSNDGGRHFSAFWQPFQTGGGSFDPVNATTAYRWTGVGSGNVGIAHQVVPANALQQTYDGGIHFTPLAKPPASLSRGGTPTVLFTGGGTVDGYFLAGAGTSGSGLAYTGNGGDSWSIVQF